jgi:chromosomal replication initiation ATPase DnaA
MSLAEEAFAQAWAVERPTMADIIAEVAKRRGISVAVLKSSATWHSVSHVRQEAMWECRQQLDDDGRPLWSFLQIGRQLGKLHHTTVLYGCRAHARRIEAPQ